MPSMLLNIQNFLSEVKKKYDKLHKKISENDRITRENLVDYLGRIMSRGAHTNHRINSGTCELRGATPWRAENTNSKHIRLPIVTESPELNPVVQDKASILLDIFDAFELGFISRHSFFGVMIVHEYTSYGVMRSRLPISKLNFQDNKQLNQLKNQVLQFKEVFGQYCQGKVMSRDAFKSLLDAICEKEEVNEVMDMFEIRDGVSFGQFLSSIPFLLEHYDKFSVKISNDANI